MILIYYSHLQKYTEVKDMFEIDNTLYKVNIIT